MIDTQLFTFNRGYCNSGDNVNVEDGSLIEPSANVLYDKYGKPVSYKNATNTFPVGGSRAFPLDNNTVGFLGLNSSSNKANGNIIQGVGKSIWFVGNSVANGVRVYDINTPQLLNIGGTRQVETLSITLTGAVGAGTITITITSANLTISPITVTLAGGITASQVATAIRLALRAEPTLIAVFYVGGSGINVTLTDKTIRANDATLNIALALGTATNVTAVATSTNTTAGAVGTSANLSSQPQFSKWNGTGWDNPVEVGVAEIEDAITIEVTTQATLSAGFQGHISGSTSVRVARKRYGSIGIASKPSNVVEGEGKIEELKSGSTVRVPIPPLPSDGSTEQDNTWVLYFTYRGLGSTATHKLFPIEIREEQLSGTETAVAVTDGNARALVTTQHPTDIAQRIVEVEFLDNDLLLLEPFDDYYPLESCKFMAKLGNVMCGIGTGDDGTGFDVSYPNQHEAYPPDWRDWFSEVPVSIAQEPNFGFFWVLSANSVYIASWTGVTTGSAPVIIEKRSSLYGCIGEGACVSVHGILYFLTKGKTLVRITPDGRIDIDFAIKVKDILQDFTSDTQLGWDETSNSIILTDNKTHLTYQMDRDVFSSTLATVPAPDANAVIDAVFSMNGNMYMCIYDSVTNNRFDTFRWNYGGDTNWNFTTKFYGNNYNLKDIIELRAIVSSEVGSGTITFASLKNYDTTSPVTLATETISAIGDKITVRKFVESLDYDVISAKVSGTKGGQTVHLLAMLVDTHGIDRLT